MKDLFLSNVQNQNKILGQLFERTTNLTVGQKQNARVDFVVKKDSTQEFVEKVSSGTFVTKGTRFNVWTII